MSRPLGMASCASYFYHRPKFCLSSASAMGALAVYYPMSKTDQCLLNWNLSLGASGPQLPALSGSVLGYEGWAL